MKIKINSNPDFRINLLCCILFGYYIIQLALNSIVNNFLHGGWWDSAIVYTAVLAGIVYAIPCIIKRVTFSSIVIYILFILFFSSTIIFDRLGAQAASDNWFTFFFLVLPYVFVGNSIRDFDMLQDMLYKTSKIVTVAVGIWYVLNVSGTEDMWVNFMGISYSYLPFVILSVYRFFKNKSISSCIWMIVSLLITVLLGTRGVMLFSSMFFCVCILHFSKSFKAILSFVVMLIIATVIVINFNDILTSLDNLMKQYGIVNGGIQKMLYANDVSNGRYDLYKSIIEEIDKNVIWGQGVFADRTIIGVYVHLLPLELLLNYGYILGGVFIVAISTIVAYEFVKLRNNHNAWCVFCFVLFPGIFKLFFSNSYLAEPYFFVTLGICLTKFSGDYSDK